MAKRKCKACDDYQPKETMLITPVAAFCDDKCKREYASKINQKAADKRKEKAAKANSKKGVKTVATKKPARKKLIPKGKLIDKAATILQKLVRVKAANDEGYTHCRTCNTVHHWKELQGGHYIPRGNLATKLMEENVHPQCRGCNGFGMKYGDAEKHYTFYMVDMYGRDFVEEMLSTVGKPYKLARPDIEDMLSDYKAQLDAIMSEKGFD